MLAALHHNVRAIVNPSILELEVSFERVFCTLRIKVVSELFRVIVVLPIDFDVCPSCSFLLMWAHCVHQAADRRRLDGILQATYVVTNRFESAWSNIRTFSSTGRRASAHISVRHWIDVYTKEVFVWGWFLLFSATFNVDVMLALIDESSVDTGAGLDLLLEVNIFDYSWFLGKIAAPLFLRAIYGHGYLWVLPIKASPVNAHRRRLKRILDVHIEVLFAWYAFETRLHKSEPLSFPRWAKISFILLIIEICRCRLRVAIFLCIMLPI